MAEYVPTLLKLVPFLLGQLEKELSVSADAEKKFQSLKELIKVIERFLKKANSMEVLTEELKASVKRARKVLYVFEDAIDDFEHRGKELNWEGFIVYLYRHSNRRSFASKASHIIPMAEGYMTMERDAIKEALRGASGNYAQSIWSGHRSSSIAFSGETDRALVGIDKSDELVALLTAKTKKSKVIFVHGPAGVGKTSLVGAVLRNGDVKGCFKHYVWIEDLRSCESGKYSAAALMRADAKMWGAPEWERRRPKECKLKKAFTRMEKERCSWVLVIDAAKNEDVFVSLQSCLDRTHPSVLVTTQIRSLRSRSKLFINDQTYDSHDFEHVLLTEDESRSLFWQKMSSLHIQQEVLGDASNLILKESSRLPLEILATCDLLNCFQQRPSVTGSPDAVKWKRLSGRLGETLLSNGQGGPIRRMRAPSMDPLLNVRACYFYLSMFPLDCPMRCSTMIRLWMAERFIEQEGAQPIQEKAEEILEKLLDENKILAKEETSYGRVKICGVSSRAVHERIILESIKEEFAMIVDCHRRAWPENVWHLSFHTDMDSAHNYECVGQLRSLLVCKKVYVRSLQNLLKKAKRLKVLGLQSHLTEDKKDRQRLITFPVEILRLKYLRYLSLRGTQVGNIPRDINDLTYLETLDLRDTLVCALPTELKLKALCHLLVSNIGRVESIPPKLKIFRLWSLSRESPRRPAADTNQKLGVTAPSKLGDLTSLQKLCMIEPVKERRAEWLEELGKLTNLQRLGLSMLETKDGEPLCSSIEKMINLEALRLIAAKGNTIDLPKKDNTKALEYLQRVHLTGRLKTFPDWILSRDSLVKLVLKGSQLTEDLLQKLEEFSCLKHLELEKAFDASHMKFGAGKFQKLCFLGLDSFDKLLSIEVTEEALPTLECVSLARCKSLIKVPQFIIKHLTESKCLEYCDMHKKFDEEVEEVKRKVGALMKADIIERQGPVRATVFVRSTGEPTSLDYFNKS